MSTPPRQRSRELSAKLETLPDHPGVYMFYNSRRAVIYVGKAKNLRNRVRSYFNSGTDGRYQYPRLVASIYDVELILTRTEIEALTTEQALIQFHRPRFNVDFRDDKSYPYLMITREPFPRVFLTRRPEKDGPGELFGPFTDVRAMRNTLRTLVGLLQIRQCRLPLTPKGVAEGRFKLCLDYHIGLCGGPCEGHASLEDYQTGLTRLKRFILGFHDEVVAELDAEMRRLAGELRFEEAARARDRVNTARRFTDRMVKVSPSPLSLDVINFVREDSFAAFAVINVRGGRIVGQSPFHLERTAELDDAALLERFLTHHYTTLGQVPNSILLPAAPENSETLKDYLAQISGDRVELVVPQRGEKHSLVQLAHTNAGHILLERRQLAEKRDFVPRSLKALQESLRLEDAPVVIEAFDVSHLHGTDSVAAMVCFRDAKPYKSAYRLFKIKSVAGVDDFAAIAEAVTRRYRRLQSEIDASGKPTGSEMAAKSMQSEPQLPNLVVIDGGKGQLGSAMRALKELGLSDLPIIGLAKRLEEVFLPGQSDPMTLPRSSSALRLLQQLRDEAHRFAVSSHRLMRGKRQVRSKLDEIAGVGPSRRKALLTAFGSVKRIAEASVEEITAVKGIPQSLAERIKDSLASGGARSGNGATI